MNNEALVNIPNKKLLILVPPLLSQLKVLRAAIKKKVSKTINLIVVSSLSSLFQRNPIVIN